MIKNTLFVLGVVILASTCSCNKGEENGKPVDSLVAMDTTHPPVINFVPQKADNNILAAVRDTLGKWGFINTAGEVVIPLQFEYVGNFSEGLVETVQIEEKGGVSFFYMDGTGKKVLSNPEWKIGSPFERGHAMVGIKEQPDADYRYKFIDKKGNYVKNLPDFPLIFYWRGRMFPVRNPVDDKFGFIDTLGNVVLPAQFLYAKDPFYQDITVITAEVAPKKYLKGYIDLKGKWVVEPTLDEARQFIEGKAVIHDAISKTWGYIDSTGKKYMITEPGVELYASFCKGLIAAKKNGKWGFMDDKFNWVIQPAFASIHGTKGPGRFYEGFHSFNMGDKKNPRMGVVDRKGNIVIQPFFKDLGHYSNGLIYASHSKQATGKYGYLDVNGNWAIMPRFSDGSHFMKVNR